MTGTMRGHQESRSPKKGLVVPNWPRHKVGDFELFSTISWWWNYHTVPDVTNITTKWWCTDSETGKPPLDSNRCLPENPDDVRFVPIINGLPGFGQFNSTDNWDREPEVPEDYSYLMSFNEPNQHDQSNLSPAQAAIGYIEYQNQYPDKILVSPSTGHVDTEWFDQFWSNCTLLGCRIDYLATHKYKSPPDVLLAELKVYSERYDNKKIWLTEFARANEEDEQEIINFIEEFLPKLECADFIDRYSWWITRFYPSGEHSGWFWVDDINGLIEQDSVTLTRVGEAYDKPYHLQPCPP